MTQVSFVLLAFFNYLTLSDDSACVSSHVEVVFIALHVRTCSRRIFNVSRAIRLACAPHLC